MRLVSMIHTDFDSPQEVIQRPLLTLILTLDIFRVDRPCSVVENGTNVYRAYVTGIAFELFQQRRPCSDRSIPEVLHNRAVITPLWAQEFELQVALEQSRTAGHK